MVEDDHCWKTTFIGRQPSVGRRPLVKMTFGRNNLCWKTTFAGKNVHIRTTSHSYKNHLLCVQKRTHFAAHSALRHFSLNFSDLYFWVIFDNAFILVKNVTTYMHFTRTNKQTRRILILKHNIGTILFLESKVFFITKDLKRLNMEIWFLFPLLKK